MKNNTPPVSRPTYSANISTFINTNVPDTLQGQPVNFLQTFNTLGGLTIWGAPISQPQPDPANANFIYQRFQRGIMHFTSGTGTAEHPAGRLSEGDHDEPERPDGSARPVARAALLQPVLPGQNGLAVPPGRPGGTDLTFAFEKG